MKSFIHHILTLIIGLIGFIGGLLWSIQSNWEYEPLIIMLISATEVVAYFIIPKEQSLTPQNILTTSTASSNNFSNSHDNNLSTNNGSNIIDIRINEGHVNNNNSANTSHTSSENKNFEIDSKKNKISILFIDDDKNFNIVKILKDSGWKNTKTVIDVKTLDDQNIKNAEIIFVDINGVGKMLSLPNEGLDLALMIKQKYQEKKIIIYSANSNNNTFHEAWDLADSRLAKNALPYQFQHLVEKYSLNFYNN